MVAATTIPPGLTAEEYAHSAAQSARDSATSVLDVYQRLGEISRDVASVRREMRQGFSKLGARIEVVETYGTNGTIPSPPPGIDDFERTQTGSYRIPERDMQRVIAEVDDLRKDRDVERARREGAEAALKLREEGDARFRHKIAFYAAGLAGAASLLGWVLVHVFHL